MSQYEMNLLKVLRGTQLSLKSSIKIKNIISVLLHQAVGVDTSRSPILSWQPCTMNDMLLIPFNIARFLFDNANKSFLRYFEFFLIMCQLLWLLLDHRRRSLKLKGWRRNLLFKSWYLPTYVMVCLNHGTCLHTWWFV